MKKTIALVMAVLVVLQTFPAAVTARDIPSQTGQESLMRVPEEERKTAEEPSYPAPLKREAEGTLDVRSYTAPTALWIDPSETNGIASRIDVFRNRTGYQLFLPGSAVLSECFLSWDGDMQATVDGQMYRSGSCPVPALETEAVYSFNDETQTIASFNITVYQGSADVQPVYIVIDESGDNPTIAEMDSDPDHEVTCTGQINIGGQWYELSKMKGRGNVTWDKAEDKHPYNITLGTKIKFPGIDSEKTKKWSFLAEIFDHSLLCNRSGFYLAHEIGVGQDTASADVWMNGEYQGCYTVTPKTDSFVTKDGFLIEQDNYLEPSVADGGDPQFTLVGLKEASGWSSCYNRITVKKMGDNLLLKDGEVDESPENLTAAALQIQAWLQDAWDAIRSDDGYNSKQKYYTEYIDIESFAKMYLMHEYVKSYDVCAGSILYHRDGQTDNDKLIAGPIWDLDNALGATFRNRDIGPADDRVNGDRRSGEGLFIQNILEYKSSVYKTLSKHEDFMAEVTYQYNKYKAVFNGLEGIVENMADSIEASARMNHIKVEEVSDNFHYYRFAATLGSGQYQQTYLTTTDSKTDWGNYVANLETYIRTRTLWFADNYYDPSYVDPADCDHQYVSVVVPATCTSEGSVTYTCPICRDSYTEVLPKIPHSYSGEWSYDGDNHWHACECGDRTDVAAHTGGEATCARLAICAICGAEYGELSEHTLEKHERAEATLQDTGNIEYYSCSICGRIFSDENGENEIAIEDTVLPVLAVFEYTVNADGVTVSITKYNGADAQVQIPETIDGYAVTGIGDHAFAGCHTVISISIPQGVTGIGEGTFMNCANLAGITIPDTVTDIGLYAFQDCPNLTLTVYPDSAGAKYAKENGIAFLYCVDPIDMVSVTLSAPAYGKSPEYAIVPAGDDHYTAAADIGGAFTGGILWEDVTAETSLDQTGAFEYGHVYRVSFWLLPEEGYRFADTVECSFNGETITSVAAGDNGERLFRFTFEVLTILTGWQKIEGKWYFYDPDGSKHTGWLKSGNDWYYLNAEGAMQTGWVKISGIWYYLNNSGAMQTGWVKVSDKWYYLNSSGAMQTGWVKVAGKWYYLNSSGAMRTGWQQSSGYWYYLEDSGVMLANTSKTIGGKTYFFNAYGICTNP